LKVEILQFIIKLGMEKNTGQRISTVLKMGSRNPV